MKLIDRVLRRSGELVFDTQVDGLIDPKPEPRLTWLRDWIGSRLNGARVADVGCWTGGLLAWALEGGAIEATGIDLPGPWLEAAHRRAPSASLYPVASLSDIPASLHNRFDFVFFLETLEHLPRHTEIVALTSLRHLLVPGGWLILSTPITGMMKILDPAWFLVGHRHYSLDALLAMLKSAGLRSQDVRWSGNFWTAISINCLYVEKHLLRRQPRHHLWLEDRADRGLRSRPSLTSTNLWVSAVATE